jgi:hypothetical protein
MTIGIIYDANKLFGLKYKTPNKFYTLLNDNVLLIICMFIIAANKLLAMAFTATGQLCLSARALLRSTFACAGTLYVPLAVTN